MLFGIFAVLFVLVCAILVLLVLVQSDKGGGISGAIGGGVSGANTVIGAQNAENILTRGTTIFAVVYFVMTIVLSLGITKLYTGTNAVSGSALKERAKGAVVDYNVSTDAPAVTEQPVATETPSEATPAKGEATEETKGE